MTVLEKMFFNLNFLSRILEIQRTAGKGRGSPIFLTTTFIDLRSLQYLFAIIHLSYASVKRQLRTGIGKGMVENLL